MPPTALCRDLPAGLACPFHLGCLARMALLMRPLLVRNFLFRLPLREAPVWPLPRRKVFFWSRKTPPAAAWRKTAAHMPPVQAMQRMTGVMPLPGMAEAASPCALKIWNCLLYTSRCV